MQLKKLTSISFLYLFFFTACASVPRFTSKNSRFERNTEKNTDDFNEYSDTKPLESTTGVASFYADDFNGKITYSGEVYDMYRLSAAHPFYQMGTIIRVTNSYNNRSVIIKINDRMPFRPDRIIDLSLKCAEELDMVNAGIQEVRVDVLEWGKGKK
jgi:rare lipoprotein A